MCYILADTFVVNHAMETKDKEVEQSTQELQTLSLDYFPFLELPVELILRVCDFLESATVINVLGKVCQFLALLAAEDLIWRTRVHKRWPGKRYPPVPGL